MFHHVFSTTTSSQRTNCARKRLTAVLLLSIVWLVLLQGTKAHAAVIYGTSAAAELTGMRTVTSPGLTTAEADWLDADIAWEIADNGNGTFDYEYTLTGFDRPGVSHFTIDISDDAVNDPNAITNALLNGNPVVVEVGDKDGITGAAKLDEGMDGTVVYSFTSNRAPVYGHALVKAGADSVLTNTGFGDQSLMDPLHYIARPNGIIPEPSCILLLLIGTVPLVFRARRKR